MDPLFVSTQFLETNRITTSITLASGTRVAGVSELGSADPLTKG